MNKKLCRGGGYIGGVCKGLGDWSGVPSILWRIAFIFIIPWAFFIYVALWIFIKKDFQN